jgi:hypothetical protein
MLVQLDAPPAAALPAIASQYLRYKRTGRSSFARVC